MLHPRREYSRHTLPVLAAGMAGQLVGVGGNPSLQMAGDEASRDRGRIGRACWHSVCWCSGCQFGHEGALDAKMIGRPHPGPTVFG